MPKNNLDNEGPRGLNLASRRVISVSPIDWIKTEYLTPDGTGPLVIKPSLEGVDPVNWVESNKDLIESWLLEHGGLLFRDFSFERVDQFERFVNVLSPQLLEYRERSSPRSRVQGNIYTSTEYAAGENIFLHNENSYQHVWPMKVYFFCETPAQSGGETPVADIRRVLQSLSPQTVATFKARQCRYVRNFDQMLGLSWQAVFQTQDRALVESYCREANISFEWKDHDRLRTSAVRPAIAIHPRTGEPIWFNHVAFFHVSTLAPAIQEGLLVTVGEEDLPANTYYGDGSSIEPQVLDDIREAYRRATCLVAWKRGDVLLLDNMLMAHGREPYVGARKILVALAEPFGFPPAAVQHSDGAGNR
jgi:alpha-ketoglutarate-dependent taurine dioxygenase